MKNNVITFKNHLRTYHRGEENAVKSFMLEAELKVTGATIRNYVNDLRRAGVPICSSEKGYFYAARPYEIRNTMKGLKHRANSITGAISGLEANLMNLMIEGEI